MAKGAPLVAHDGVRNMFLAALPLGSRTAVHGALCVAREGRGFSQGDVRHLQHASSAVGGALTRIAALSAEQEAERAVKVAESELRAAAGDRVLLAEQMVGIVSHDLRNPLSAILMGTTLLGMGEPLPEQKERVLQKVRSAANRAQRLVEELLDFTQARVGKGLALKRADVNLDGLMTSIVDELRLSFPDVALDHPDKPLGSAYLDADRIHQLLGNGRQRRHVRRIGQAGAARMCRRCGRTGSRCVQPRRAHSRSNVRRHVRAHDARGRTQACAARRRSRPVHRARHRRRSPWHGRCDVECGKRHVFYRTHATRFAQRRPLLRKAGVRYRLELQPHFLNNLRRRACHFG
jgi:hypothetical protein